MTVSCNSTRYTFHIPSPAISSAARHQQCGADRHPVVPMPSLTFSHAKASSQLRALCVSFSTTRSVVAAVPLSTAAVGHSVSAPQSRRPSIDFSSTRSVGRPRSVSISTSSLRVTAPSFTPRPASNSFSHPTARSSSLTNALALVKQPFTSPASPQSASASLLTSPASPSSVGSISSFFTSATTPSLASLLAQSWSSPSSPASLDTAGELLDESELSFDMTVFDVEWSAASKRLSLPELPFRPRTQQRVPQMYGRV